MIDLFWDFVDFCVELLLPFLFVLALVFGGGGAAIRWVSHSADVKECAVYTKETGRQTKFVDYSWWSWDCMTPSNDGKWIPKRSLVEVVLKDER